jgi:hypothetical protein
MTSRHKRKQEYHKSREKECQAENRTYFVLLHPSVAFYDAQYYILMPEFVTIFTSSYEYTYVVTRRAYERKS